MAAVGLFRNSILLNILVAKNITDSHQKLGLIGASSKGVATKLTTEEEAEVVQCLACWLTDLVAMHLNPLGGIFLKLKLT